MGSLNTLYFLLDGQFFGSSLFNDLNSCLPIYVFSQKFSKAKESTFFNILIAANTKVTAQDELEVKFLFLNFARD